MKENMATKIAIIDNNESYSSLLSKIIKRNDFESLKINPFKSKIEMMLQNLKDTKPSLIFINAEICLNGNDNPASQLGVDIFKHIRLTEDLDGQVKIVPVILYSFAKDKEDLIRLRPENLIVFSESCYYFNIFELNRAVVGGLINVNSVFMIGNQGIEIKPLSDLDSLIPYVRVDTRDIIIEDRHSIANWWGPQRLLWGYKLSLPSNNREIPEGNPVMKSFCEAKKSLPVKKLLFTIDKKEELSEGKIKEILKGFDSKKLKEKIKEQDGSYKKVLYIDDEAYLGWANAFKQILFPDISQFFENLNEDTEKCALPTNGEEVFTIYQSFEKAEKEITGNLLKDYALVLLDLRDKEKDKGKQQPDELTGVSLLKKIKDPQKGDPSIPVIIITASNKQWNYERVLELGANGYWIKESPEFGIDDEYSLRNYLGLHNKILNLLSQNHLRAIWKCIKESEEPLNKVRKTETANLLKKAFVTLQYRNINYIYDLSETYPLLDVIIYLGMAWELYRNARSLKDIENPNIVDYFIFDLRGNFIHGRATAKHVTIKDIVNLFIWLRNLVLYPNNYARLYRDENERHYLNINGQKHYPILAKEIRHLSTYTTFWNYLKLSGTQLTNDCHKIKDYANYLLTTSLGKKEKIVFNENTQIFDKK